MMAFWKPSSPKSVVPPAVASATEPAEPVKPGMTQSVPSKAHKAGPGVLDETTTDAADPRKKGFDPYNSGAFNLKDTWSRVNRKK
jgi:hypothetical protein